MSEIFDNGYKAGEASYGKEKMSDFEGSQFKDEFMVGYCLARAEYEGGGTPFVFFIARPACRILWLAKRSI